MSGWGCPHDVRGTCTRVGGKPCDPGMKGCILAGRFRFSNPDKNRPPRRSPSPQPAVQDQAEAEGKGDGGGPEG